MASKAAKRNEAAATQVQRFARKRGPDRGGVHNAARLLRIPTQPLCAS